MSGAAIAALVVGGLAFLLLSFWISVAVRLYTFAIRRQKQPVLPEGELPHERMMRKGKKENYLPAVCAGVEWMKEHRKEAEEVYLTSFDGLKLHAAVFDLPHPTCAVVLAHGFHSCGEADFGPAISFYRSLGCAVVLIDQRAHGRSEGKQLTFGVRERFDLRGWLRYAAERWQDVPLFLSGISMGCASSLYAAELPDLPSGFAGVIADSGYDSPYEEVRWFMRTFFSLPSVFLPPADLLCRLFAHFSLKDCSVMRDLRNITVPVLFVHGTADQVVPIGNTMRIYGAFTGKKRLFISEGALHGCAFLEEPDRCREELRSFLEDCVSGFEDKKIS